MRHFSGVVQGELDWHRARSVIIVAPRNLSQRPTDQALELTVIQALQNPDSSRFRRVMARACAGIVVLAGSVNSYYARSLGLRLIERLPGVQTVIDSLSVALPLSHASIEDDF